MEASLSLGSLRPLISRITRSSEIRGQNNVQTDTQMPGTALVRKGIFFFPSFSMPLASRAKWVFVSLSYVKASMKRVHE